KPEVRTPESQKARRVSLILASGFSGFWLSALPASRVAAGGADIASFLADQSGGAAFRALPEALVGASCTARRGGELRHLQPSFGRKLLQCTFRIRHKADFDYVPFDHLADGGQERGPIASFPPAAAARIEH